MIKRLFSILILCWMPVSAMAAEPLGVVVSVLPEAFLAKRIGGEHVRALTLVQPGRSPADYEPTPSQMVEAAKARIWFRIGVPFEQRSMARITANNPTMQIVDLREGMQLHHMTLHQHEEHGHNGGMDPHIWTDPVRMQIAAQTIHDNLVQLDPQHQADYDSGLASVEADLEQLNRDIETLLHPLNNRKFMVYHPSWGYFAERYHLQQIAIEHEGKEPGPRHLLELIDLGRREHIRAIFVQKQFDQSQAESLASAIGAKIIRVDPLAEDYIDNMRQTAEAFAAALQ